MSEAQERYLRAAHAMQSGVAMEQELGSQDGTPKHLRVGVNVAMSDIVGLVKLLIDKGLFTLDEYEAAVADAMEREALRYEERLSRQLGTKVTLL